MITKSTTVVNPTGLHARPAAVLATKAGEFSSKVEIKNLSKDSDYKDASSMLSIMMLGITQGTEVEIRAEGEDETEAVNALVELIDSGFGE